MIFLTLLITCFITTLSTITTLLTPKPYFSSFHLVVADDDDSNMRFFRKFSLRRRLVILKCLSLSRQFEITECFNSSILVILHLLFAPFSLLFDLNDDILLYMKPEKRRKKASREYFELIRTCFDRKWSNTSTRRWDKKKRKCHAEKDDCEDKKISRCRKKADSHERDCYAKKKARRRQSSQRIRKDLEIEENLSSSTSKFFRFSVFVFANEENCVWIRGIDSSNRGKRSRQLCVIDERLYVSIDELPDDCFSQRMRSKSEDWMLTIDELKRLLILYRDDEMIDFSNNKRRLRENFLKNLILLSSSLTTTRWKDEK